MAFLKRAAPRSAIKSSRDYQCVAYIAGKEPKHFVGMTRDEALVFRIDCERKNYYVEVSSKYQVT